MKEIEKLDTDIDSSKQNEDLKNTKRKGNKKLKFSVRLQLVFCAIVIVITLSMIGLALYTKFTTDVFYNLYFENIDLSGKNAIEAKELVYDFENKIYNRSIAIFQEDKLLFEVTSEDLGIRTDALATLQDIFDYAKTGNLVEDNIAILKTLFNKKVFDIDISYDNSKLSYMVNNIIQSVDKKVVNDSFEVLDDTLIITKGITGLSVDKDELVEDLTNIFIGREGENKVQEYHLKLYETEPVALDIDSLYTSVYKEAKNAYIDETKKPVIMTSHEYGVSFDKEDLRHVLALDSNQVQGTTIKYKLTIIKPDVLLSDLKWDKYEDLLGTFTTTFSTAYGYENRNTNIKVSAKYLNGTIIMPGETFSFNKTVGDCGSYERGFRMATVFTSTGVGQGMGGGVCQTSSTLYNAALLANMEIVERYNHTYTVSYVACGRDATISYPYLDLKFKNTRNYPVKIVTYYDNNGKLTASIYGTKEDNELDIYIESYVLTRISRGTTYVKDNTLYVGEEVVDSTGQDGFTSICYRTYTKNGTTVKREVLSSDTYSAMNKVIKRGTKEKSISIYGE